MTVSSHGLLVADVRRVEGRAGGGRVGLLRVASKGKAKGCWFYRVGLTWPALNMARHVPDLEYLDFVQANPVGDKVVLVHEEFACVLIDARSAEQRSSGASPSRFTFCSTSFLLAAPAALARDHAGLRRGPQFRCAIAQNAARASEMLLALMAAAAVCAALRFRQIK